MILNRRTIAFYKRLFDVSANRLILLFSLITAVISVNGQVNDQKFLLEGLVLDIVSQSPISFATIKLLNQKSELVTGATTNDKGIFTIEGIPAGEYNLKVEFVGFESVSVGSLIFDGPNLRVNVGVIYLKEATSQLEEVVVSGRREAIENKFDRMIFDPRQDAAILNGPTSDLLRRVPMLTVDLDGNVSLRGNRNVRILVDGKPINSNTGTFLQTLSADQVEKVEVVTSPSAKFDSDGSAGVINIITRKNISDGIRGSVSAGLGTRQVLGSAGVTYRRRKFLLDVNGGFFDKLPRLVDVTFRMKDIDDNSGETNGESRNTRLTNNANAYLQYDLDEKNSISSTFRKSSLGYNDEMETQNVNISNNELVSFALNSNDKIRTNGFGWNLDFLHAFDKKGKEIFIAVQWNQDSNRRKYRSIASDHLIGHTGLSGAQNNEYTFQTDFRTFISKSLKLESGFKGILRDIGSHNHYYDITDTSEEELNVQLSNDFDYNQYVYGGYLLLQGEFDSNFLFEVGSRIESTQIEGESQNEQSGIVRFRNSYLNYLPSVTLARKFDGDRMLKISYNSRIQRPSLTHINPFRVINNPLDQSQGTSGLSPEKVQSLELGYNSYVGPVSINVSLYYKRTSSIIDSFTEAVPFETVDEQGNSSVQTVVLSSYRNVGYNNSFGVDLYSSCTIKKVLDLQGSINAFTYEPRVYSNLGSFLEPGRFVQYSSFISASLKISKSVSFEAGYSFQSKVRTFQGTVANLNILDMAIKKSILKGKGSLSFSVVNPFANKWDFTDNIETAVISRYNNLSVPFRSFNLKFSYNFGNDKIKSSKRGIVNDDLKQ